MTSTELPTALCFDLETAAISDADVYLEAASAPANYKDPDKIKEYIAAARLNALGKAALMPDLGRVIAVGVLGDTDDEPAVRLAQNEDDEIAVLEWFWNQVREKVYFSKPTLIGFNCLAFDLPMLIQRSLYLDVKPPRLSLNKYRHDGIEDLLLTLTFGLTQTYRSLDFYCRRFKLDVPSDTTNGSDMERLVAEGKWDEIENHCRIDVLKTAALARRVGAFSKRTPS